MEIVFLIPVILIPLIYLIIYWNYITVTLEYFLTERIVEIIMTIIFLISLVGLILSWIK